MKTRWWWLRWAVLALVVAVLASVGGFAVWALNTAPVMPEALVALQSGNGVQVEQDGDDLIFRPETGEPHFGVIIYPGGRVDPRAYAPLARSLAGDGLLVVIPSMPLNMAFFAPSRADAVIQSAPGIRGWVIGGHSLGGAMAASYAKDHPDRVLGLFLWAAYPAPGADLSRLPLQAVSVYGSDDCVATPQDVLTGAALLPPDAQFVEIVGGNHAQFGWYGDQVGDNPARISREEQQAQILQAMQEFLVEVEQAQ